MNEGLISGAEIINLVAGEAMAADDDSVYFGLGINDPKRIFGTTAGLVEKFGEQRVFDTPTSENAMTGIGIGLALSGVRTIMCHQRLDFFLLAFDQLVNVAAKWHYMYGGQSSVPITIRLIVGRGWGQGPTHSQSFQSIFGHIPGLKVFMPSSPEYMGSLFSQAIKDPNPVVFVEHRWLHSLHISQKNQLSCPDDGIAQLSEGDNITIVSTSYQTIMVEQVIKVLDGVDIGIDHFSLMKVRPMKLDKVFRSLQKTGRLLVVDTGHKTFGVGSEVIAQSFETCLDYITVPPINLGKPSIPDPTSPYLTKDYYITYIDIARSIEKLTGKSFLDRDVINEQLKQQQPHDIPGKWFTGPF